MQLLKGIKRDSRSLALDVVKDSTNVRHVQLRMSHAIGVKGLGIIVHSGFQLEQWAKYTQISEAMSSSQPFSELSLQLMVHAMHGDVKMSGRMVQFKLDTGAEVRAISDTTFRSFKGHRLIQPSQSLYGPACSSLEVIGQFDGRLSYGRKSTTQTR